MARVELIPFELWMRIFAAFTLHELRPILQVCSTWRAAAIACDAYGIDITLSSLADGEVEFFLYRLSHSKSRPSDLTVVIHQTSDLIPERIIPALAEHLDHLASLIIQIHALYGLQVMDLMRCPAPRLRCLAIMLTVDDLCSTAPVLPADVFSQSETELEYVALRNVYLPAPPLSGGLPGFANVQRLVIMHDPKHAGHVSHLWERFPALMELTLKGALKVGDADCADREAWGRLQWLRIELQADSAADLLARAAIHDAPRVTVESASLRAIEACVGHLSGPLALSLRAPGRPASRALGAIEAVVEDVPARRARTLTRAASAWLDDDVAQYLRGEAFAGRIVALTVADSIWTIAAFLLPPLHSVVRLTVECGGIAGLEWLARRRLCCPNLESLALRNKPGVVTVTPDEITQFLRDGLGVSPAARASQVALTLEGVRVLTEQDAPARQGNCLE